MSVNTAIGTTATAERYVGRFAPSPTGALHLGSLVAALGSFLDARHHGGAWLLRIEDLDTPRVKAGSAEQIMRTLESLGLTWDGAVEWQSRRRQRYADALASLQACGAVFKCQCTRRALAGREQGYPGTCRDRTAGSGPFALRFRVDESESVSFADRFQGICQVAMAELGDVLVCRRDGIIAYQLAVVVDDAAQGITDVLRGVDLLSSTAWQLQLQRALGYPQPRYGHLPLIVEPAGAKLAKSRRSLPVESQAGAALFAALGLLQQAPPAELAGESPQTLLKWALAHWQPTRLQRVKKATVPSLTP